MKDGENYTYMMWERDIDKLFTDEESCIFIK